MYVADATACTVKWWKQPNHLHLRYAQFHDPYRMWMALIENSGRQHSRELEGGELEAEVSEC
jgi:hypothetical protein